MACRLFIDVNQIHRLVLNYCITTKSSEIWIKAQRSLTHWKMPHFECLWKCRLQIVRHFEPAQYARPSSTYGAWPSAGTVLLISATYFCIKFLWVPLIPYQPCRPDDRRNLEQSRGSWSVRGGGANNGNVRNGKSVFFNAIMMLTFGNRKLALDSWYATIISWEHVGHFEKKSLISSTKCLISSATMTILRWPRTALWSEQRLLMAWYRQILLEHIWTQRRPTHTRYIAGLTPKTKRLDYQYLLSVRGHIGRN